MMQKDEIALDRRLRREGREARMNRKEIIAVIKLGTKAKFLRYRGDFQGRGNLIYGLSGTVLGLNATFEFPVPVEDVGIATFGAEEKAILLMRWINRQLDLHEEEQRTANHSPA